MRNMLLQHSALLLFRCRSFVSFFQRFFFFLRSVWVPKVVLAWASWWRKKKRSNERNFQCSSCVVNKGGKMERKAFWWFDWGIFFDVRVLCVLSNKLNVRSKIFGILSIRGEQEDEIKIKLLSSSRKAAAYDFPSPFSSRVAYEWGNDFWIIFLSHSKKPAKPVARMKYKKAYRTYTYTHKKKARRERKKKEKKLKSKLWT